MPGTGFEQRPSVGPKRGKPDERVLVLVQGVRRRPPLPWICLSGGVPFVILRQKFFSVSSVLVFLGLCLGTLPLRGQTFGIGDLDVLIATTGTFINRGICASGGDFNHDGFADVAIITYSNYGVAQEINLFPGGPNLPPTDTFPNRVLLKIVPPPVPFILDQILFVDLNGDHFDDLVFKGYRVNGSAPWLYTIYAVWGSTTPPLTLDLNQTSADLELKLSYSPTFCSLAKGDFNGDGRGDLMVSGGDALQGNVYLFMGKPSYSSSSIFLDDGVSATHIYKSSDTFLGQTLASGDINGDGKSDLILSDKTHSNGASTEKGKIYVVLGSAGFPTQWNLDTEPADYTLFGTNAINSPAVGDWTGDGIDDLFILDETEQKGYLLDGLSVANGPSSFDMTTDVPANTPIAFGDFIFGIGSPTGDFDGDGKADLFSPVHSQLGAFLSNDYSGQPVVPSAAFQFSVTSSWSLGDINGDGKKDLVVTPEGGPSGSVGIIYGYHPLDNPAIHVQIPMALPQAVLELSVEGDPKEMNLSGDFLENTNGKWVPFQRTVPVTLTQTSGEKHLRVLFRNSFGRTSSSAVQNVLVEPGFPRLEVVHNDFELGGPKVRIDCHLLTSARVKASLFDQAGVFLGQMMDSTLAPGVWPIEWDGKNSTGQSVSPGVYYMSIDIEGRIEKKKILLRH